MTTVQHEWWGELRHGGMLVAPQFLDELIAELPELDEYGYDRLRSAWLRLDAALYGGGDVDEARRDFASQLLETFLGLDGWQKASAVAAEFKSTSVTGESLRPNWVLLDPDGDGALLAVWFDGSDTVGRGRGVRAQAKLVELLRATGMPLGLLTNGRQFRLVHAGPDYDAWAEWDAQTWFDESEGRETLRGLAALLQGEPNRGVDRIRGLIRTIHDSRNRQGDLAQVLGEQVRQGIELLVREVDHKLAADSDLHAALVTDPGNGHQLSHDEALAAIYQAATRVVMRLVLVLYAEARDLLPANVEAYHDSYGVGSLYDALTRADREARDALAEATSSWPRMLSLFRVVYFGSGHADLPVRAYGGQLFRPGNPEAPEPVLRALAALEAARPADAIVYRLLRLLKVGKVKVRAGRGARWVAGAVDFSDLRTEYVGIVYEGLLDYELRRADADDPIVLLNVGRQPALPLSRLSELTATEIKELLKTFRKDASSAVGANEEDRSAEEQAADEPEDDEEQERTDEESSGETDLAADDEDSADAADDEDSADDDARARVLAWAREAVEAAGIVRRPQGANPDLAAYEQKLDAGVEKLLAGVIPPGRLYLVASGGLRKGSGSFYTRPALSVPLTHRALEPLCYDRDGDRLVPRTPEEILNLKVCEPAMGSGSFLVAALRFLVEALHRSLEHHGRIKPKGERETVVTLPFGSPAIGDESEEPLPLPPEDDRFPQMLRSRLARHVVERCLYGVDRNPMAVELARLALWVETLDRELPFEYLDHKLKVGDSLVGCWLGNVDDYPIRAWEREAGDGAKGDRTKALAAVLKQAKAELPDWIRALGGAKTFFDDVSVQPEELVARVRARFEALHSLSRDDRERAYRDLLDSEEYQALKAALDTWCAAWFWPTDWDCPPLPRAAGDPEDSTRARVALLAAQLRFFHWELEFPDVFGGGRRGFDAILGNPPWETVQAESREFFSRYDPLYRTYSKTLAVDVQKRLFQSDPEIEVSWNHYVDSVKAFANFAKASSAPFAVSLGANKRNKELIAAWTDARAERDGHRTDGPFRLQGDGKLYTYRLFLEAAHHVCAEEGRLGMVVPSGLYTDHGSAALRKCFLEECRWDWAFFFENREELFPIHRSFKFGPVLIQRGGPTRSVQTAFMRHSPADWERATDHSLEVTVADIRRFSPSILSFMEFSGERDQTLVEQLYGERALLGAWARRHGGAYSREFNMTTADKHFTKRRKLESLELVEGGEDLRDPRVRARIRVAGYVPVYEGKSFWLHNPYYRGTRTRESVSKAMAATTVIERSETDAWKQPRLAFRHIARTTDQRTLIVNVLPPAVHADSCSTLDGLGAVAPTAAVMGSLVADYLTRMKVSANLNWFYIETLPMPAFRMDGEFVGVAESLVWPLNAVGADFGIPDVAANLDPAQRLVDRLMLDAWVAHLFELHPDDFGYIATRFPIYDGEAGQDYRYSTLATRVYEAFHGGGSEAAERRAAELVDARGAAGVGFGLDELWQPDGGWQRANDEAREILAAGVAA